MTEAKAATLARCGEPTDRALTWVQASLLIDAATGAERGSRAERWLREKGASPEEAARTIEQAERALRGPAGDDMRDRRRQAREAWAAASRGQPQPAPSAASTATAGRRASRLGP
jgi:hypothetical protein